MSESADKPPAPEIEPGVVSCPQWRPDVDATGPGEVDAFGGVGRKA